MPNRRLLQLRLSTFQMLAVALLAPLAAAESAKPDKAPTAAEQAAALATVRDYALNYAKRVPDYICSQATQEKTTTFSVQGDRKELNVIEADVGVLDHQEVGMITKMNGQSATIDAPKDLAEAFARGEFAGLLERIFGSQPGAEVRYDRVVTKDGKRQYVFSYRVPKANGYPFQEGKGTVVAAFKGSVFADFDTKAIVRVEVQANEFPGGSIYKTLDLKVNYKLTRVADQEFSAPSDFELNAQLLIGETKLTAEYKDYRLFPADAARQFRSAAR
jgi:hypothetical protein